MESAPPEISGKWAEVLKLPSGELTEYVRKHPLHLKNVLLKRESISRSEISKAIFDNVYWDDSYAQNALILNAKFNGGVIYDTSFANSHLVGAVFDHVFMDKGEFVGAKLDNVVFKNCDIVNSEIRNLHDSRFRIENCEIRDTNFFQSKMDLEIVNSKGYEGLDFGEALPGSTILIKNSYIGPYSVFSKAEFDSFVIESSRLEKVDGGDMTIRSVSVKDSEARIDFGGGDYQRMVFYNSKYAILWESRIGSLSIVNYNPGERVDLEKVKADKVNVRDSTINVALVKDAAINEIYLTNTELAALDLRNARIRKLVLQNVKVTGKADLSHLVVEDLVVHGLEIAPNAVLNLEGSTVRPEQLR